MIALHCIMKMKVYCQLAARLTSVEQESTARINELAKKHLKLLNLIETAESVFNILHLITFIATLGLLVTISFQTRYGFDYCSAVLFVAVMIALFFYCFLSECISTTVKF